MAENPSQYAKQANEGILLGYPVKIKGQSTRPDNGIGTILLLSSLTPQKTILTLFII